MSVLPTGRAVRRFVTTALTGLLALAAVSTAANPASAATARNNVCYFFQTNDGAVWHNYDYTSKNAYCNNVDWATSLMFYEYANIDKVKSILHTRGYGANSTNSMHMPIGTPRMSPGVTWDSDAGKKGVACPGRNQTTRHYRIYAPPAYQMNYSVMYGYFVVASTHWDGNECWITGKRHWGSEEVETHIGRVLSAAGYQVNYDWANYSNWEPYRVEGNHTWENDGWATFVRIP